LSQHDGEHHRPRGAGDLFIGSGVCHGAGLYRRSDW
jgi:hypothetical protein